MDISTIITIATIVVANIGTTVLLFTWATSHAAQDSRDTRHLLSAIHAEIKDFHGRLCSIEAKRK